MFYKKQFMHFTYDIKKQVIRRFMLFYMGEYLLNLGCWQGCFQISFMPFLWLMFTKKHFSPTQGCFLFIIGFLWYFRAYPLSGLALIISAVVLFVLTYKIDIDRIASPMALLVQSLLFIMIDPVFNRAFLVRSVGASLLILWLLPQGFVPLIKSKKEKIFV